MKQLKRANLATGLFALILAGMVTGCEKDIYNPDNDKGKLPPKEDYFPFELKGDVQLTVNYASQDLKILFEVYTENPLTEGYSKKEGVKPVYAAYTDKDGKYTGKMSLATTTGEVYLYTEYYGFPKCIKAEISNSGVSYVSKAAAGATRAVTRADVKGYDWSKVTKFPYSLANFQEVPMLRRDNLYALYPWGNWGTISKKEQIYNTPSVEKSNESMDNFTRRIQNYVGSLTVAERRSQLLSNRQITDIEVKEDDTTLDVVFMGDAAMYANVFGYYYYTENEFNAWDFYLSAKKKYVIFPNASYRDSRDGTQDTDLVLEKGTTVKLQYFGPDGKSAGTYNFPKGYKIGWIYGRNSFVRPGTSTGSTVDNGIPDLSSVGEYSSEVNKFDKKRRFISLKDAKTGVLVLGFEDNEMIAEDPGTADKGQEDYIDVLFYVNSNKDIAEGKPEIPEEDPKPEIGDLTVSGTLAFEDIWPNGGDYDLNDVMVEYERKISFDGNNKVTKVVETFKPVHPRGSALHNNYFACQYNTPGTLKLSEGMISETATNSVVISESALTISGKTYVVERDLTNQGLSQNDVEKDFNPYIITGTYTTENRSEVHLPLKEMTSAANKDLMNKENAYYVSKDGKYPFAIDIPITGFVPADETKRIDLEEQYPNFKLWTESKGASNQDWYNTGKGKK